MTVALVHDQLSEFGGAERVLLVLHEMYPTAPIYTAFVREGSEAAKRFAGADIRPSWAQRIPGFATKLHSPLRFLAPLIWESFDFTGYDLVISSAGWFITKGILTSPRTVHISYVHSPPRYLYGYPTSIEWRKYWPIRLYGNFINHFLREYDFVAAQRPDVLIANSENTRGRIQKFYRRDSTVIYPPVELPELSSRASSRDLASRTSDIKNASLDFSIRRRLLARNDGEKYYLVVSRVVGGKGLALAVQACTDLSLPLKVVGQPAGWASEWKEIRNIAGPTIEFLGFVPDDQLVHLYSGAQAFLATAQDEDFGMTVVEAQLAGTPVIAYRGGGYMETVVEGKTGEFFDEYSIESLKKAIQNFTLHAFAPSSGLRLRDSDSRSRGASRFTPDVIQHHAQKFSKERFVREMKAVINAAIEKKSKR